MKINLPTKASTILLYLIIFIFTFPKTGFYIAPGLDPSWKYAFNHFFANNIQIGKDVLFTYGPLGFLLFPQPIGNNLEIGIFFIFITHAVLISSGLYTILFVLKSLTVIRKVFASLLFVMLLKYIQTGLGIDLSQSFGFSLVFLVSLLLLNYESTRKASFILLSAFYVAFILLMKSSYGIVSLLIFTSYLTIDFIYNKKRRAFFLPILTLIGSFVLIWALVYRNLQGIFRYLFGMLQFSIGNSSAMTLSLKSTFPSAILGVTILIFFIFFIKEKKIYLISFMFFPALIAMYKYAFAREDTHIFLFLIFLMIFLFLILIHTHSVKKFTVSILVSCFLLVLFCIHAQNLPAECIRGFSALPIARRLVDLKGVDNLFNVLRFYSYKKSLINASRMNLKGSVLSRDVLAEIGQSTVDVYPWETSYIPANDLNWKPRPVFQSYVSYTPWLDSINYNFFARGDAPTYIIWETDNPYGKNGSIDGRYLFSDEPMTIYKILDMYIPVLQDRKVTLLRKKEKASFEKPRIIQSSEYRWNEWIKVPVSKGDVIRARIRFSRTTYGKLKRFLSKEREVFIDYRLEGGRIARHRLVIDNAVSGVWMHPYIESVSRDLFNGIAVSQIKLSCAEESTFMLHFFIDWERLSLNT